MSIATEEASHCVDAIVRDAADADRERGIEPKVNEVRAYVQGIVERMDRKNEERRHRIAPKPTPSGSRASATKTIGALETEFHKRLARAGHEALPGTFKVTRTDPAERLKSTSRVMAKAERLMRTRLRLLRSKPEWANRLKTINPLALQGSLGPAKQEHAKELVRRVIDDSARVFGPWWKEAPRPIWDSGQTKRG